MSQLSLFDVARSDIFSDLAPHIVKQFWAFHEKNPEVFKLFKKFTNELLVRGRKRYGIGSIAERIRWHVAIETTDGDFKLNNNLRNCYARFLIMDRPELKDFFQLRETKGYRMTRPPA